MAFLNRKPLEYGALVRREVEPYRKPEFLVVIGGFDDREQDVARLTEAGVEPLGKIRVANFKRTSRSQLPKKIIDVYDALLRMHHGQKVLLPVIR